MSTEEVKELPLPENLKTIVESIERNIGEAESIINEINENWNSTNKQLGVKDGEISALGIQLETLRTELTETTKLQTECSNEKKKVDALLETEKKTKQETNATVERLQKEIASAGNTNTNFQKELSELKAKDAKSIQVIANLNNARESSNQLNNVLEKRFAKTEQRVIVLNGKLNALKASPGKRGTASGQGTKPNNQGTASDQGTKLVAKFMHAITQLNFRDMPTLKANIDALTKNVSEGSSIRILNDAIPKLGIPNVKNITDFSVFINSKGHNADIEIEIKKIQQEMTDFAQNGTSRGGNKSYKSQYGGWRHARSPRKRMSRGSRTSHKRSRGSRKRRRTSHRRSRYSKSIQSGGWTHQGSPGKSRKRKSRKGMKSRNRMKSRKSRKSRRSRRGSRGSRGQ